MQLDLEILLQLTSNEEFITAVSFSMAVGHLGVQTWHDSYAPLV
jgi:hypothetical protein